MSAASPVSIPSSELSAATAALLAGGDLRVALPWRALAVTGPDAATFLQGQLTTDVREVGAGVSRLGCLLNLKGRVQISFRLIATDDGFLMLLPADQLAPAQARLAKYAVFSKVTLAASDLAVTGVLGEQALAGLAAQGWSLPAERAVSRLGEAFLVHLPGLARALLVAPGAAPGADAAALAAWDAAAIAAGEYHVPAAASEQHQPQEIDYHTLLGVSYQKGCYLGQEIVARLYFRGQLKSGLCRLQADWPADAAQAPAPGQAVLAGEQAVGEVLALAWPAPGRIELLAIVRLDAEAPGLDLGATRLPLRRADFVR